MHIAKLIAGMIKPIKNFKGDKSRLIWKPNINFCRNQSNREVIGIRDREVDSEYKLFELANLKITDNDEHELFMLSDATL